jgi:hypothetical protein
MKFVEVVPPAGVVCWTCQRGPYRSRLAAFPHALVCAVRRRFSCLSA